MVFYAAGCDAATTSKTSKNVFNNKYLRVIKNAVFLEKNKIIFNKKRNNRDSSNG